MEQIGNSSQKQLVQRHADIYFDYMKEFNRFKKQMAEEYENEEEAQPSNSKASEVEREALLKERVKIDQASTSADHVIE